MIKSRGAGEHVLESRHLCSVTQVPLPASNSVSVDHIGSSLESGAERRNLLGGTDQPPPAGLRRCSDDRSSGDVRYSQSGAHGAVRDNSSL